jgi:[acyl-carrier-protein] S-malonyltransferase
MGRGFYWYGDECRKTLDEADSLLGFSLTKIMFDGPIEALNQTSNTQPALLASSVAALRALRSETHMAPAYYAGHSLGEYTALVAAGALTFVDALRLVRLRGIFMQEAVPEGKGTMSAVLGLQVPAITEACASVSTPGSEVVAANINSPGQVVISGEASAVERAGKALVERGAKKVIPLSVSVPSHSPLMATAAERLSAELAKVKFSALGAPVVTNVEARPVTAPEMVPELLKKQLTNPVRWVESIEFMIANGVGVFIEVGPSKVLTSLIKRINKDAVTFNVSEPADIAAVKGGLA